MGKHRNILIAILALLAVAGIFRVIVARRLATDIPGDSKVYAQAARNLLEQHVYSHSAAPPYEPSLIRLPGYSIFLASVYSVFGHYNNTAVRVVQALIDTATCGLVGLVAYYWEPDEKRKRVTAIAALALAVICPFTTIYVATVLTETWACFLAVLLCLLATLAFKATTFRRSIWWWTATGLVGGTGVFFRPDAGLFVAAVGLTLVVCGLIQKAGDATVSSPLTIRFGKVVVQGAALSIAFALVLVPWTIRNWRQFHLFMPLAPTHGEMPNEFVPNGFNTWVRSWLDDRRYIEPMLWSLDEAEIDIDDIPARAFDSPEEKARVARLLELYNDPNEQADDSEPAQPTPSPSPQLPEQSGNANRSATPQQSPSPEADDKDDQADDKTPPDGKTDKGNSQNAAEPPEKVVPEMTPAIDAGFAQIARERISRAPLRYYLWVPLKRARSLWFGPHSDYFPFTGEMFPWEDMDYKQHQQIWLPLFSVLVWVYTLLGVGGAWVLWRSRNFAARRWMLLAALLIFVRLAFFSSMENPEPRYTVEFFPFLAILGGIVIARFGITRHQKTIAVDEVEMALTEDGV